MPKKITIQDVKAYIDENANGLCTLLSTEYITSKAPLRFRCNVCGEEYERSFSNTKIGRFMCTKCARKNPENHNKRNIEYVRRFLEEHDIEKKCTLLSNDYKNNATPLLFHCNVCGKTFTRDFSHVQRSRFACPTCGMREGGSYQQKNGISPISETLRSASIKWKKRCIEQHPYCDISGSTEDLQVHHLNINFQDVVAEAMNNLGIKEISNIKEIDSNILASLREEIERIHLTKVEGIVLTKKIHKEFHHIYGYHNTKEQYIEFKNMKGQTLNGTSNNKPTDDSA